MKILCVCDQGVNRSVTLAHQLKYLGHDTLTAGLSTNEPATLLMLFGWADRIITTDGQVIPPEHHDKVLCWDVGADRYPRPFNPQLLARVRSLVADRATRELGDPPRRYGRSARGRRG